MTDDALSPPVNAKVDPETLAIRTRPARAVRFRKGAIVAIAALGSISLVAVTWMALKPNVLRHVATSEELSQPSRQLATDTLNRLPESYADAPKLGPPLPGDLGRPILEHQRALVSETDTSDQQQLEQAEAAERQRRLAELKAARESAILFQSQGSATPQTASASDSERSIGAALSAHEPESSGAGFDTARDPNAQTQKAAFVSAQDTGGNINPHLLTPTASPFILSAGSVIPASLITGLRSDLPGLVTAQVTERVYDSPTGRILLIPQGARLIGSYDSVVAFGQKRALIVWQRIVMPDGSSLKLDNVPATDAAGYAGLEDKVDFHTWTLLKGVVLSTLLGVGSELALSGDSDLVDAIRHSTQNSSSRAGDQITSRNLNIQPTITIRPGARVRLVVHRDLVLPPWKE